MENTPGQAWLKISLYFLFAMILTILPLPNAIIWLRPQWIFLVLIFLVSTMPQRVGVGVAFFVGLLLDLLQGTLLGEHALALSIIAYIVIKIRVRLLLFPLWQQTMVVMFLCCIYLAIQVWVGITAAGMQFHGWYWLSVPFTGIFWPWLMVYFRDQKRRLEFS